MEPQNGRQGGSNDQTNRHWTIALGVLMLALFWNLWLPSAKGFLNTFSPTLQTHNVDFYAYYRGGQAFLKGIEPYAGTRDGQLFIYPPTFVPLFGQIARLDYDTARYTWAEVYTLIFLCAVGLLLWWLPARHRLTGLLITFSIVLLSYPVLYHIRQGQVDFIVASFCFASLVFYMKGRETLSAFCLATATLIKLNPVFFLITFVVFLRNWKFLVRYGLILAGFIVLSTLFFPLDWYRAFIMEVLPTLTKSNEFFYNQSLLRFFAGDRYIPRILTLLGIVGFSLLAWWAGKKYEVQLRKVCNAGHFVPEKFLPSVFFLMNAIVILLFSGSAWIMAYVWFILPVVPVFLGIVIRGKTWLAAAFSVGVAAAHSILYGAPVFNAINMIGASICLFTLAFAVIFPKKSLKNQSWFTD